MKQQQNKQQKDPRNTQDKNFGGKSDQKNEDRSKQNYRSDQSNTQSQKSGMDKSKNT